MIERLLRIDAYLIDRTQTAYLWLWDRTGIYVATPMFAACAADHFCYPAQAGWLRIFGIIVLGWFGLWCGVRYLAQATNDLRRLNAMQRGWAAWSLRPYFILLIVPVFLFQDIVQLNALHTLGDLFFAAWNYLGCVQVRDREPKEFFPSLKPVGAGA